MSAVLPPQVSDVSLLGRGEEGGPSSADVAAVTVFRAFDTREFREWPGWKRVRKVLASNGGSYGLSGPRGAGKTWLMLRAVVWARGDDEEEQELDRRGLGLWYPSPSEYEPLAFLASLTDSLAAEIKRRYRAQHQFRKSLRSDPLYMIGLPILVGCVFSLLLWIARYPAVLPTPRSLWPLLVTAVIVGLVTAFLLRLLPTMIMPHLRREERLVREATLAAERARYSAMRRETAEVGAEAGRGGFVGRFRTSRERELVERPATLSSLVTDFRALAEQAGEVAGRVVIAIDELDKMDDPGKVRALLRDIKGVFEVPRVHFFVSVSDEAARSLNLGALTGRDEFNSSFYTVIELPPVTPEACAELLQGRAGIARDVALALAILSGGNPREVVRLADLVGDAPAAAEAVTRALREEALSLRNQIVTSVAIDGVPSLGREARVGAFDGIPEAAFDSATGLDALASTALGDELWTPSWRDDAWEQRFGEAWQRLLVRIAVAGEIVSSSSIVQDSNAGRLLQNVIVIASQSAQVARIVLERRLQVDVPDVALAVEQEDARARFDALARQYEEIRARMKSGSERTAVLEDVVRQARSLARDADFGTDELIAKLRSGAAGDRVVGLAAIEVTGDHGTLNAVLEEVTNERTPFEQYHAFQALESLRPSLSENERTTVLSVLKNPTLAEKVRPDTDRARLHARVLAGFSSDEGAKVDRLTTTS
jgi:hypothetical protein